MDQLEEARQAFLRALALQERGEMDQAEACYKEALALAPERPSVMSNLAAVHLVQKKYDEARRLCERLVELDPNDETAFLNLGSCQSILGALEEALASYDRALAISPHYVEAFNNRGNVLLRLGRKAEALASYEQALAVKPDYADALYNRGNALLELDRPEEALAAYERALEAHPDHPEALFNRANALLKLGRTTAAVESYNRALAARPDHTPALSGRGIALLELGRQEEVTATYKRLLDLEPDHPYVRGSLLNAQLHCCDWTAYEDSVTKITEGVRLDRRVDTPFNFLAISHSPTDQLRCARINADDEYPAVQPPVWRGERYRHDRIRLAYLSADLRNHAIPFLIAGLFEKHDRTRFEVIAISLGPARKDEMRTRLESAFDRFIDIERMKDIEVASLLRDWEVDIAVDLQGYTKGCRPGIFAQRVAPVQVNYLGYPGTMGADYMDYIVADRQLIPPEHCSYYAEKVVYLPDCYQPNDAKRMISERVPTRAEAGLPERGFVFCCFNNNYKINPPVFEVWMRLLRAVDGSVLWLLEDNEAAARNLRQQAAKRGVAPERLVFAPRMKMEEHLARHRRADLFLDTLPYGAHTTASDALWAGLPVLTCLGGAFAGRVAASLLTAVGLPELITTSREEYERLALELARDPVRLSGIKTKLARNRLTQPLFNTDRFRKHIEAAYITMWEKAQRGEPPESFAVDPKAEAPETAGKREV